jgi:hypothetical protein
MDNRIWKVKTTIGPYDGPFAQGIITHILISGGVEKFWHEGPNKKLNAEVGDYISGLAFTPRGGISYKKSKIVKVILQPKLDV